ncbi:MAG TPA: NAD(P)/FAD-dependent oxidoreductase [Candidatus Binataceae bacterium]|nr:NAD(P)/FAD-dependent oxidoreductase [Candidatus Binataceae bacterium]
MMDTPADTTVIIGAGPAGLSAAHELCAARRPVVIVEQDPEHVGGIARTVSYKGFRFDIGGHRFFSKNPEIEKLWSEILGERMLERARLSRIYYRGRFFKYPLETRDALRQLGMFQAAACMLSYLAARLRPQHEMRSFEDWVVNAFGRRLYETFFKSYTEKVWGIPCNQISADWAAQRIKDLSMRVLIKRALGLGRSKGQVIKTLIDRFRYPLHGPGEMWEELARTVQRRGAALHMGESVTGIQRGAGGARAIATTAADGTRKAYAGGHFISTMPIRELVEALEPAAPAEVRSAANSLKYRDFITVALIVDEPELFPDNWIYIHEPGVGVGRIQNFKNWSPAMVADPRYTVLGLEYFCFDSDAMWSAPDQELVALGAREIAKLGLAREAQVVDGTVVRQRAAYPVYDGDYARAVETIRTFIEREVPNLQLAGRNGMHKYNNQDHAMMTGLMAARNIMGASYDLWRVNSDAQYLEEDDGAEAGLRLVPRKLASGNGTRPHVAIESVAGR